MNAYRRWLKARIDELSTLQEWEPDDALWDHSSLIVAEAARRAATLGLSGIYDASLTLPKTVNAYRAVGFLTTCMSKAVDKPEYLTPPQVAKKMRVSVNKVLNWIRSGDLQAQNTAQNQGGQPRYRIDPEHLATFRTTRQTQSKPKKTKKVIPPADVIRYF